MATDALVPTGGCLPPPDGVPPGRPPSGAGTGPDPLTEQALRRAESEVLTSPGASAAESARAHAAIDAARALAARGQAVAARLLAEQAARNAEGGSPAGEPGEPPAPLPEGGARPGAVLEEEPRMVYQDRSNDPQASFQYPTSMTAAQAAIMVPAHEQGHIIHAQGEAMTEEREIVLAYTRVLYRMNWRTGRLVAAGGQAVVKTRPKPKVKLPFPQ